MSDFKILQIDNDVYQQTITRLIPFVDCPEIESIDIATPKQYLDSLTRTDITLVITKFDLGWTNAFQVYAIKVKLLHLDGTLADNKVSAIAFIDDKGLLLLVILLHITSRKQAETALQNSQHKQRELSNHLALIRAEESTRITQQTDSGYLILSRHSHAQYLAAKLRIISSLVTRKTVVLPMPFQDIRS
ncbi:hypothetical protein [Methylomonas sp. AM2-LC]|uniref:hypothetical protein n=1 Tax=Methylomonas sp. AM2-LC TaxID=3153301 RepID=UPI0032678689